MPVQRERRCGIYLRISDDREGRELGVVRQQEDCMSLSERLHCTVHDLYKDNDISASTRTRKIRPAYQRLLADARAGAINTIIAYTSGRLTRRPREHEDQIELAEQYGVQFHYVASPSFDLNTAAGRRIARMLAANDAGEAEDTAERVARAKLANAVRGEFMGGARAYGFEGAVRKNGVIINRGRINVAVIERERAIWCDCVRRIITGTREMDLVRYLNKRSIPSPRGAKWRVGNLRQLLSRKRYVIFEAAGHPADCPCLNNPEGNGTLLHQDVAHRAIWPGFITAEEHEQLLSAFEENSQPWAHGLIKGRAYLLSGFTVCGRCGGVMSGNGRTLLNGTYQRRYRCRSKDNHGERLGCGSVYRDAAALEELLTLAVFDRFASPELARALAQKEGESRAQELRRQLDMYRAHRQRLVAEYGRGEHRKADFKAMLAAADGLIDTAQAELGRLHAGKVAGVIPAEGLREEAWEAGSIDWRRSVIRLVVDRVVVHPSRPVAPLWHGHRFNPDDISIHWRNDWSRAARI